MTLTFSISAKEQAIPRARHAYECPCRLGKPPLFEYMHSVLALGFVQEVIRPYQSKSRSAMPNPKSKPDMSQE